MKLFLLDLAFVSFILLVFFNADKNEEIHLIPVPQKQEQKIDLSNFQATHVYDGNDEIPIFK